MSQKQKMATKLIRRKGLKLFIKNIRINKKRKPKYNRLERNNINR